MILSGLLREEAGEVAAAFARARAARAGPPPRGRVGRAAARGVASDAWPGTWSSSAAASAASPPRAGSSACSRTRARRVTLVNDVNFMLYTPLLPGRGGRDARAAPRRRARCARSSRRTDLRLGTVTGADPERKVVCVALDRRPRGGAPLRPADRRARLDVAHAARSPGWPSTRIGFKTLPEAIALRNRAAAVARAGRDDSTRPPAASCLTFVFVGARLRGPRGPRRAAGLRRRRDRPLPALPRAGHALHARRGARAGHAGDPARRSRSSPARELRGRGIEIRTDTTVEAVTRPHGRALRRARSSRRRTVVWTAGVKPHPVVARARAAARRRRAHRGRPLLHGRGPRQRVGDRRRRRGARPGAARASPSPPTAQHALRQGRRSRPQRRRRARRRPAPAPVPLPDARRVRRHGPPPGRGEHARHPLARLPGVVPRPHLPPGADAGHQAPGAPGHRLDGRPALRARLLRARPARPPAGARADGVGRRAGVARRTSALDDGRRPRPGRQVRPYRRRGTSTLRARAAEERVGRGPARDLDHGPRAPARPQPPRGARRGRRARPRRPRPSQIEVERERACPSVCTDRQRGKLRAPRPAGDGRRARRGRAGAGRGATRPERRGRPPGRSRAGRASSRGVMFDSSPWDRVRARRTMEWRIGDRRAVKTDVATAHEGGRARARRRAAAGALRAAEGGEGGRRRRAGRAAPRAQAPPRGRARLPRRRPRPSSPSEEATRPGVIEAYLPAELSDDELDALVAEAVAETGAEGPRDMGQVIKHVMAAAGGRADGKRVSAQGEGGTVARRQLELTNEVAAELAGAQDAILKTLEEHLERDLFLRGNVVTLDGDAEAVQRAATVVRELAELVARGHDIAPGDDRVGLARARPARVAERRCSTTSSGATATSRSRPSRSTRSATSTRSAARRSPSASARPAPARPSSPWPWPSAALQRREVNRIILTRPAVEAGERLGFLPGDLMAKVDPYLRPLFDALHDMMERRAGHRAPRARRDRGRAARLHARPHAQRLLHHPRRGAEHHARADEDVPDAPRLRLEDGRHRRHHADRPAARAAVGPRRGQRDPRGGRRRGVRHASAARTSCATSSSSASSPPTTSTPPARRRSCARRSASARREPGSRSRSSATRSTPRHGRAGAACSRPRPPASRTATSPSTFVDARRDRRAQRASTAASTGPTDVLSFPVDGAGTAALGERELGDVVICPEHTVDLREAVVHGVLHLVGHGPRDRRRRDARPAGGGADVESAEDPLGLRGARRPAERRQVDARQRDGRPQGGDRLRQAADDPARDPRRRHARRRADRARPTCRASSARATSSPRACSTASSRSSPRPTRRCSSSTATRASAAAATSWIAEALRGAKVPVVIAVNKVDRTSTTAHRRGARGRRRARPRRRGLPGLRPHGRGVQALVDHLAALLPEGPFYFPPEEISDQPESVLLAELVREQVLARTRQEVPHSVEVAGRGGRGPRRPDHGPRAAVGGDRVAEGHRHRQRRPDDQGDRHRRPAGARARARRQGPPRPLRPRAPLVARRRRAARPARDHLGARPRRPSPSSRARAGRLDARAAVELAQDVAHVHVDRARAEEEVAARSRGSSARRRRAARPRARGATARRRRRRPRPARPSRAATDSPSAATSFAAVRGQRPGAELARAAVGVGRAAPAPARARRPRRARRRRAARPAPARTAVSSVAVQLDRARELLGRRRRVALQQRGLADRVRRARRARPGGRWRTRCRVERLGAGVRAGAVALLREERGRPAQPAERVVAVVAASQRASTARQRSAASVVVALRGGDAGERGRRVDRHVVVAEPRRDGQRRGEQPPRRAVAGPGWRGSRRAAPRPRTRPSPAAIISRQISVAARPLAALAQHVGEAGDAGARPRSSSGVVRQSSSAVSSASSARR